MTDPQLPPPSGAAPPAPQAFPTPQVPAAPYGYPAGPPASGYPAAPPGAYQVPVGGYAAPAGAYAVPETTTRRSRLLGLLSLILALIAAVVMPIIAGINAFVIGRVIPPGMTTSRGDLRIFSPVRDQVLWTELSFWTGTLLGIAAIVLGIIAIRRKQGRGAGIAALVVAALGAVIFAIVLVIALGAGSASGLAGYTAA